MRIVNAKNTHVTIITLSDNELKICGKVKNGITIAKLKSRKNTYRIWVGKEFSGNIFV